MTTRDEMKVYFTSAAGLRYVCRHPTRHAGAVATIPCQDCRLLTGKQQTQGR